MLNKIDLPSRLVGRRRGRGSRPRDPCVRVSATAPLGLDALRQAVIARAGVQWADNLPPLTSARQRDALAQVDASLAAARAALRGGLPPDLVAVDVQAALDHIGAVTGVVTSEDVLDAVFREFCIGK